MHRPLNGAVPERSEGGAQLKGVEATFHALRLRPSTAATGFSLAGEVEGRPPLRALAAGFSLAGEVEGRPPLRALAAGFSLAGAVEGGLRSGRWAQVVCLPAGLKGGPPPGALAAGLPSWCARGVAPPQSAGRWAWGSRCRSPRQIDAGKRWRAKTGAAGQGLGSGAAPLAARVSQKGGGS